LTDEKNAGYYFLWYAIFYIYCTSGQGAKKARPILLWQTKFKEKTGLLVLACKEHFQIEIHLDAFEKQF